MEHPEPQSPTASDLQRYFVLDPDRLSEIAKTHRAAYAQAHPFPHIVLDGLFPEELLRGILAEFPSPQAESWRRFHDGAQKKLDDRRETSMGPLTRLMLYQLNSSVFMDFLETITGIEGLIPDPHFGGGGLHQIERGGFLKVHADFNWHPKLLLDRRLNLLLYLNENWEEAYGGQLELWDRNMTRCQKSIYPLFNRCVIFNTTDFSYHGHPDPVTCPEGRSRKSLALYYYSNGRPAEEKSAEHSTVFRERPGEAFQVQPRKSLKQLLVPPIVFQLLDSLRKRPPQSRNIP